MISLAKVLSGKPILLTGNIYFHQPTLQEIEDMGENVYWSALNLWTLRRKDLIAQENEQSRGMDDYTLWLGYILTNQALRVALMQSCNIFLKTKVEFFDISGTIYIGEKESGIILDNTFYLLMKEICMRITPDVSASEEKGQYRETDHMSERERQLIEKIKAAEKKLESAKTGTLKPEDFLGDRILGLVAVGNYTFEQVYNMTMLQFNMLLQKYIDVQSFELRTMLSPYMSSEDDQNENKFWLG